MEKRNMKYYENTYENLQRKFINASSIEEKKNVFKEIRDFISKGSNGYKVVEAGTETDENYYAYRNKKNYSRVVSTIPAEVKNTEIYNNLIANAEINRSKKTRTKRYVKRTLRVAAGVVAAVLIISGLRACNKKNKDSNTNVTTTTIETTLNTTAGTTTTSTSETTSATTTYDSEGAVPSMSKEMDGIQIQEPTATTAAPTNGNSGNGGSNNGGSNNGGTNNGGSNNGGSSSPAATEGTKATEGTTATTTTQPSATTTETNPEVPGTTPVETENTEPANPEKQRDITVDVHDGENPKYIEEDPNESYPTYINVPTSTTKATDATTAPTTAATTKATEAPATTTKPNSTVNGMPVEEDPDETYETYFNAGTKTNSKEKTLSLRK